ncbi:MAG: two pore domain potassium channel family protein [Gammaproteobacteria bacterium]|nr:two pore domain potassium channel family protein [Gammaproteobacteria bacterium]
MQNKKNKLPTKKHKLLKFRELIGSAGVDKHESDSVRKVGLYFGWLMLIIVFWLPFQWHFSLTGFFSPKMNLIINWCIWAAFTIETTTLTLLVKRKWFYLLTNWLSLVIIFGGFPFFWNYTHFLAMIRIFRILFTIKILIPWLSQVRTFFAKNHLGVGILVFVIGTFLGGILISSVDPGISDPLEGIWWAWQTVTTVGYGDFIPVSWPGRIIGIIVMLMGLGLFSLITANFSAFLIGKGAKKEEKLTEKAVKRIEELSQKIEKLELAIQKIKS